MEKRMENCRENSKAWAVWAVGMAMDGRNDAAQGADVKSRWRGAHTCVQGPWEGGVSLCAGACLRETQASHF